MKRIFTGEEQAKDTFICTLIKLFGIEKYNEMEKFCNEIELSFCILNDRNINDKEYFEFLNNIKFNLMEETRNSLSELNKDGMNIEYQEDTMDMDDVQRETFSNISKLIEEANTIEPSDSREFSNPVFNTNFYVIYLLVLIINNQIDGARYLYRRLPKPILNNRSIIFIKEFLSLILKKNVGSAISILNKEIENENERLGKTTEKEEDLIEEEEEIIENNVKQLLHKDKNETKEGDDDEKMDIYLSDKTSRGKTEANIVDNTPEQSSGIKSVDLPSQVDTPEETMKDIDYDKEEDNDEDNDDDDDDDDNDDDDDDSEENSISLRIDESVTKMGNDHLAGNNTMTPVETHTPLSTTDIPVIASASSNTRKTYFKIKRCSLFIIELLNCLLETIRKRQILLMAKAYDHILINEVAKNLDYPENKVRVLLTKKYGWEIDSSNTMFMPKREVKEVKQEMSINNIHTLIDHLIFLEDSDQLQKIDRF